MTVDRPSDPGAPHSTTAATLTPVRRVAPARNGSVLLLPLRVIAFVLLQVLLLGLGLSSLAWNFVCLFIHPVVSREAGLRIGRAAISRLYRVFWIVAGATGMLRMDARVLDALADERGLIVVSNHPSMLDALMLVSRLPRSVCVMKASLLRNPFLGPGARLARYIRNDSANGMIRLAVKDLRDGGQLVIFPEGTRTTQQPLNPFLPGFALIAKLAKVPVQTVFIDTDSPYLGKGWPLWRLPPLPIVFSVRMGQRFEPGRDPNVMTAEVERYLSAGMRHHGDV
jgi:1-acyl-sn-glycerol-3-phosphate acyltransferase